MKKIILLLMVVIGFAAKAQITHTSNGDVDKNAQEVLSKAAKKMNTTAVSFSVTMINKDSQKKETGKMSAQVLYDKSKYRVSFDNQILYSDGSSVWHWNKETNECTINKLDPNATDDLMNPALLLKSYQKNFRAKYIRTESNGTAIIDLTPKKSRSYYKIRLLIVSSTGVLKQMEMHNYDGSCGEFHVSNFKAGVQCTEADFALPKGAKVEIIDMR